MGIFVANYRQWLRVCPQAPKWGNRSLPTAAGVPGAPRSRPTGGRTRGEGPGRCPGHPRGKACCRPGPKFPKGPKPGPPPKSVDETPAESTLPERSSRECATVLWLPRDRWGARWPQGSLRVPWARSPPGLPGPSRRAQLRGGLPYLSGHRTKGDRAPDVCALGRPGPWRPGAILERAAPSLVRWLFLGAEDGERRGTSRPRPARRRLGPARSTQVYFLHLHT